MSKKDECEIREIRSTPFGDNLFSFTVVMDLGENRTPNCLIGDGDAYKLTGALTTLRHLDVGERVMRPGVNGSQDESGTVLYHHARSGQVAWITSDGSPVISERHRLTRLAKEAE